MRGLAALLPTFLAPGALAVGMVLPFDGPDGHSTAEAVAEALNAPPAVLSALLLPEPPWGDGWRAAVDTLASPAGAHLIYEASGADWVVAGQTDPNGEIRVFLYNGQSEPISARFGRVDLASRWLGNKLGQEVGPTATCAELEPALIQLLSGTPETAQATLMDLPPECAPGVRARWADVMAAYDRDLELLAGQLPEPTLEFWRSLTQDPPTFDSTGIGPVWNAYIHLLTNDTATALQRATELAESPKALEQLGAFFIFLGQNHRDWPKIALKLTESIPELALGWEQASFAAFNEQKPAEAVNYLTQALSLQPNEPLYWTNLGWAYYLTGNLTRALQASERAWSLQIDPASYYQEPTAGYNLGLFRALTYNYRGAQKAYQEAMQLDRPPAPGFPYNPVFPAALDDLSDAEEPRLDFFIGYLGERTGELETAKAAYQRFVRTFPGHPLAEEARRGLSRLQQNHLQISLAGLAYTTQGDPLPNVAASDPVYPKVQIESDPSLPSGELVSRLIQNGTVQEQKLDLSFYPLTSAWEGTAAMVKPYRPGPYRLEVSYLGQTAATELEVVPTHLARQLFVSGVSIVGLAGQPILNQDLAFSPNGERELLQAASQEIRAAAPYAARLARYQTPLDRGPFAGQSVAQILVQVEPASLAPFFQGVLAQPEILAGRDIVNAFAEWLLQIGSQPSLS